MRDLSVKKTLYYFRRLPLYVKRFIGSIGFESGKLYIFKYEIDVPPINNTYDVKIATNIDDLSEIVLERGDEIGNMYITWLNSGFTCLIATNEGKTVGLVWIVEGGTVPLEFRYKQKLKHKNEVGLIDAYVLKRERGKGVYRKLWNTALSTIYNRGCNVMYGYILDDNELSFKVHYKMGMVKVDKILKYDKFLVFRIYRVKKLKKGKNIKEYKRFLNE